MENTYKVFTRRMALFIQSKGIQPVATTKDEKKPGFINWLFPDTKEVRDAMDEYTKIFYVK